MSDSVLSVFSCWLIQIKNTFHNYCYHISYVNDLRDTEKKKNCSIIRVQDLKAEFEHVLI